jgi:hypothetical protein
MKKEIRQKLIKADPKDLAADVLRESPILSGLPESEDDVVLNISLRPKRLSDFVGQKETIENLKICLAAAKQRKESL